MQETTFSPNPILVVEDDKITSSLIRIHLEREGFPTLAAYDGQQALAFADQLQQLFVVLDPMLTNVDGGELCRTLPHASDMPILILTARE